MSTGARVKTISFFLGGGDDVGNLQRYANRRNSCETKLFGMFKPFIRVSRLYSAWRYWDTDFMETLTCDKEF
jgi:hypothetical protein